MPDFAIGKVNACLADAPQADVKRALSAVSDMGIFYADDEWSKFRQCKPNRDLPPEHARLGGRIVAARRLSRRSLSGNHENHSGAVGLRAAQEPQQRRVCLFLREAVQIEPGVDRGTAAGDALSEAPSERRKRRRLFGYSRVVAHRATCGSGRGSIDGGGGGTVLRFGTPLCLVQRRDRAGDARPQRVLLIA